MCNFLRAQEDSVVLAKRLASAAPAQKFLLLDSLAWYNAGQNSPAALAWLQQEMQCTEENNLKGKQGRIAVTRAHIYRKSGNFPKAAEEAELAATLCKAEGDSAALYYAYLESGNLAFNKGDYATAIRFFILTRQTAAATDDKAGVATGSNNIANVYYTQGQYEKAIENYQETKDAYERLGDKLYVALTLDNIGNCYQKIGKKQEAVDNHLRALHTVEETGDSIRVSEIAINLAVFYIDETDHPEQSIPYLERALSIGRLQHYFYSEAIAQLNLSEAYMKLGQPEKALDASKAAAEISKRIGMIEYEYSAYEQLARIAEAQGKPSEALAYYKKYMDIRDTMYSTEKQSLMAEMAAKYETEKKDNEISELTKDRKEKQAQLIYLSAGLLVVLVFAFALVRINGARKKANRMLEAQNAVIAGKNKDITDSITYASRIQRSVMPDERILGKYVQDYFIFNKPRDIVSGDFFWVAEKDNRVYAAVADCTGHGVPGALVSVIGINMLNKAIEMPELKTPSAILAKLHVLMIHALNKDAAVRDTKDGMDIGLLCVDKTSGKAFFSGAGRPLYCVQDGKLDVIKGDRFSIAGEMEPGSASFKEHTILLSPGTKFYLSSDGFVDQFGEQSGKKFLSKRFQEMLMEISAFPMQEQKQQIEAAFENWKGKLDQVDDVLVAGILA